MTLSNKEFWDGFKKHIKANSLDNIISDLPEPLKSLCNYLVEEVEKEVFLIGSIGVISGLLPNVKGIYSGKPISPNLYVYILAGYGGGKGSLDYARELGKKIHIQKKEDTKLEVTRYLEEVETYKKELKAYQKSKNKNEEIPKKPKKPNNKMLFIPSNNSKSGIYQLLEENQGCGILFESEGDTLSDALKQDYGNFSDTLRKAFHHESLDLFRRGNEELIEIESPRLSVILSSTYDQLRSLIPSAENGLFSRFIFYELKQNHEFFDVFNINKSSYNETFFTAGEEFKNMYNQLDNLETTVWFNLTNTQVERFLKTFNLKKKFLINEIDPLLAGTANRLGIIAFRLMMILSVLRAYDEGKLNNSIICQEVDFENAMAIIKRFEKHAQNVYNYLNSKTNKKELIITLRKAGKSINEISRITNTNKGTISKLCSNIQNNNGNPFQP